MSILCKADCESRIYDKCKRASASFWKALSQIESLVCYQVTVSDPYIRTYHEIYQKEDEVFVPGIFVFIEEEYEI